MHLSNFPAWLRQTFTIYCLFFTIYTYVSTSFYFYLIHHMKNTLNQSLHFTVNLEENRHYPSKNYMLCKYNNDSLTLTFWDNANCKEINEEKNSHTWHSPKVSKQHTIYMPALLRSWRLLCIWWMSKTYLPTICITMQLYAMQGRCSTNMVSMNTAKKELPWMVLLSNPLATTNSHQD